MTTLPNPLQAFRDREAREARRSKNLRLAQAAFFGAALIAIAALVVVMRRGE